jgi:hypothetical protein
VDAVVGEGRARVVHLVGRRDEQHVRRLRDEVAQVSDPALLPRRLLLTRRRRGVRAARDDLDHARVVDELLPQPPERPLPALVLDEVVEERGRRLLVGAAVLPDQRGCRQELGDVGTCLPLRTWSPCASRASRKALSTTSGFGSGGR